MKVVLKQIWASALGTFDVGTIFDVPEALAALGTSLIDGGYAEEYAEPTATPETEPTATPETEPTAAK
jgi:hypothetical protein